MQSYKAVIVGCGRIGVAFNSPNADSVLTHANAFSTHPKVQLAGVMDIDGNAAKTAATKWGCPSYTDFQQMLVKQKPDIISICVPDAFHFEYLVKCLTYRPKAVICEKPLTLELSQSEEIVEKYRLSDVPLFANYTRRYDTTVQALREHIKRGGFGNIFNTTIKYTKGLLHNGSHAIDVANFLFGECLAVKRLGKVVDFIEDDPTLSAVLNYSLCPEVFLIACDERAYSIFEIDIAGERGRVVFEQFGLRCKEYEVRRDPVFEGYKDMVAVREYDTGLNIGLLKLVENVVNNLENGEHIICSGEDALLTQQICNDLLLSRET